MQARGTLSIGELPAELHLRVGAVAEGASVKLPALRGPPMLLHSKGLAALSAYAPFFAERFRGAGTALAGASVAARGAAAARQQLVDALGDGSPESKRKGEHALYSSRALAGFCLMLGEEWQPEGQQAAVSPQLTRRLVLNSNGTCVGCASLPRLAGAVGVIVSEMPSRATKQQPAYVCTEAEGSCGVVPAVWPSGSERGLPEWYTSFRRRQGGLTR